MKLSKDRATLWIQDLYKKIQKANIQQSSIISLSLSGTEGNYIYALLSTIEPLFIVTRL